MLKMFPWSICVSCMDGVFARNLLVVCLMQSSSAMRLIFWRFVYRCSVVVLSFIFCCCFCCIHCWCICWVVGSLSRRKKAHESILSVFCAALCVFSDDHSRLFCFHEFLKLLRCQKGGIVPCKVSKAFLYCFVFVGM
jgi:hypothetical protein